MIQALPSTQIPQKFLLPGVPQVGFYNGGNRCPENTPFPSCLRAILDATGQGLGYSLISAHNTTWRLDRTYTFLMGVTGCAFRLSWLPGWFVDNMDIRYLSDDPTAPFSRAFAAAGYDLVVPYSPAGSDPDRENRAVILHSLVEKGLPVIAFGVIGPPEACLVTGFDEGGDVLIGWNYYQYDPAYNAGVEFEPSGEFRKRGWSLGLRGVLAPGARKEIPPLGKTVHSALHWALRVMRAPQASGRRLNGAAAFQAWADHLLLEDAFPAGEMEILRQRFLTHDSVVGLLAEGRWYGAKFLEMVAEIEPAIEDALLNAADCFEEEHDLMWQVWGQVGGNGQSDENVLRLADPGVRRDIVPLILRAREKDIEAAGFIEKSLRSSEKNTFASSLVKEFRKMEPKFIEKGPIRLVGVTAFGKPETITPNLNDIWMNQFMKYDDVLKPFSIDKAYYGAWIGDMDGNATYIAGMAVEDLPQIPLGLEERILPAATYAVFDCTVSTFGPTYSTIYGAWLPQSAYEYDMMASDFEFYPPDTATGDSPAQVFVPVKGKHPQVS